jgi:hypothetical protein
MYQKYNKYARHGLRQANQSAKKDKSCNNGEKPQVWQTPSQISTKHKSVNINMA